MADPTTSNRSYAVPTRGSDVGAWDVPLNTNFGLLDNNLGGVCSIALTNQPVVLTSDQYQCGTIRLTGTLTAGVLITFPAVSGWWVIDNQTTGAFAAVLSCGTGNSIATEQGAATDIFTDGVNVGFRSLGKIGSYWDYAGAAVPIWVLACTIPPYLNCDGTNFSATTYPYLNSILGTTTLPDIRGGSRATLNQGTGRITTDGSGIDGDTRFSIGGVETVTLTADQIPAHTHANTINDPGHSHIYSQAQIGFNLTGGGNFSLLAANSNASTGGSSTGITLSNAAIGGGLLHSNMPPTTISGITMIRAA